MTRRELFRELGLSINAEGEPEPPVVIRLPPTKRYPRGRLLPILDVERPAGPDGEWVIRVDPR